MSHRVLSVLSCNVTGELTVANHGNEGMCGALETTAEVKVERPWGQEDLYTSQNTPGGVWGRVLCSQEMGEVTRI